MAEKQDVNLRMIVIFFVVLTAGLVAVVWGTNRLAVFFAGQHRPAPEPRVRGRDEPLPGPRLPTNAPAELRAWRAREDHILSSYGWVERDRGVVRIPIDRAMDLLVDRQGESPP